MLVINSDGDGVVVMRVVMVLLMSADGDEGDGDEGAGDSDGDEW